MPFIQWNAFEKLFDLVRGEVDAAEDHELIKSEALQKLIAKREQLEQLRAKFQEASEEEIVHIYHRMKHAHKDFMDSYHEAYLHLKNQYQESTQPAKVNN